MRDFITLSKLIFGRAFMISAGAFLVLAEVDRWLPVTIFPNASEAGLEAASVRLLVTILLGWVMVLSARMDTLEKER